jgi:two-component system response regulator AtoC
MKVLIADDEKNIRTTLSQILSLEGFETAVAENGLSAQRMLLEDRFDAVVVDLRMPGMDGLELLSWMNDRGPQVPSIMISAHGDVKDAVEAMKRGAVDYITKPFDPDDVAIRLKRAVEDDRIRREIAGRRDERTASDNEEVSRNPGMRKVHTAADRIAPTDSTVLITGESGTGKEVLARRIHRNSDRHMGPFVAINLGAIPESLIESELFGHEKGAYTGAIARRIGPFEEAAAGTLFLDEVGELPIHLQVKLLRVLQERVVQRVGGSTPIPVNVRIIAATNRDLKQGTKDGTFREDLYYRLNVIELHLPPLRKRPEDIGPLIGVFLDRLRARGVQRITGINVDAVRLLERYRFPGNIRELENIIERAVLLAESSELTPRDFEYLEISPSGDSLGADASHRNSPGDDTAARPLGMEGPVTLAQVEAATIRRALLRNDGHRERTADELGITRRTLLNKINHYGIATD